MKLSAKRSLIFGIIITTMGVGMLVPGIVFKSLASSSKNNSSGPYSLSLNSSKTINSYSIKTYKLSVSSYSTYLFASSNLVDVTLSDENDHQYDRVYDVTSYYFSSNSNSYIYLKVENNYSNTVTFRVTRY